MTALTAGAALEPGRRVGAGAGAALRRAGLQSLVGAAATGLIGLFISFAAAYALLVDFPVRQC